MAFAIIKTGGKQLRVSPGDEVFIEKIEGEDKSKVVFSEVLMIDGKIGNPFVKGATITGTIIKQGKGEKIKVIRYHPKKNVNKIYGHRQPYTKVKIDDIKLSNAPSTVKPKEELTSKPKSTTESKPEVKKSPAKKTAPKAE